MVNFLQSPDNAEQDGISHRPPENTQLPDEIRVTLCTPPIEHSLPNLEPHSTTRHSDYTFESAPGDGHSRNTLTPPGPSGSMRPTRQGLPQLAIPNPRSLSSDLPASHSATSQSESPPSSDRLFGHAHSESQSTTPETPASLSSPIVGVVDLTKYVRTTSMGPDFHGGYSDIYCGEWEKELEVDSNLDDARSDTSAPTMVEDTSISTTGAVRRTKIVKVAIKLLRVLSASGYDEVRARKRLNREVYVWHRLEHPNIVTFLGTSYHMGGRPSLVLPWCQNGCAPEYLRRNPSADRLQLILDVAQGLKYLHTMKPPIVHGDLKGNNILITDEGRGTLSDFGLAQVIEEICSQPPEYTTSDLGFGPIRWQAPELVSDDTGRPKMPGDIWSFGCTNYELLTGKLPYHFRARDPQVIQDIQNGIRPPGPEENSRRCGDNGIWDLMNDCWINAAEERIQITDVVFRLEDICARTNMLL